MKHHKHEQKEEHPQKEQKEDEDDLQIDFSKIKSFFKGSKKKEEKEHHHHRKAEDEVGEKEEEKAESQDEEISLQFNAEEFKKMWKRSAIVFLILIPLLIAIFLRAQPAYLPMTDDWAKSTIDNYLRQNMESQIRQQYPNLPAAELGVQVNKQLQTFIDQNADAYLQNIRQLSQQYKDQMKQDDGTTYLSDIDTYQWYRYSLNIEDNGHPGDEEKTFTEFYNENPRPGDAATSTDTLYVDRHMMAPIGGYAEPNWHSYIGFYVHEIFSLFKKDINPMTTFFWFPVIIASLAVIPAFFIGRRFAGNLGGFLAASILAFHPAFLSRTVGGVADTDAYNVLFPLLILWIFFEAVHAKKNVWRYSLLAISSLAIAVYAKFWPGWWFTWVFITLTIIGQLLYMLVYDLWHKEVKKSRKSFIQPLLLLVSFTVFTLLFVFIFSGKNAVIQVTGGLFQSVKNINSIKAAASLNDWPNVYTTVAELNYGSLPQIISQLGGLFLVALSLFSLVFPLFKERKRRYAYLLLGSFAYTLFILYMITKGKITNDIFALFLLVVPLIVSILFLIAEKRKESIMHYLLFSMWLLIAMYMTIKGIRFLLIVVGPFAIGLGITLALGIIYFADYFRDEFKIKKAISLVVLFILVSFLLIAPVKVGYATARQSIPMVNDAWYNSLTKIKDNSQPNAIITSWWDFGHWFKALADRPVTFDGASQNTPMAHWVGQILIEADEDKAIGLLRMLDCGNRLGIDWLDYYIKDTPKSVEIMNTIVMMQKEEARTYLSQYMENPDDVLRYTHCDPPEAFFITSQDMIGKSGVWGHFGVWDFNKAHMYNVYRTMSKDDFLNFMRKQYNYTTVEANNLYTTFRTKSDQELNNWIAEWPSYMGGQQPCQDNGKTLLCPQPQQGQVIPITVEKDTFETYIQTPDKKVYPISVVYMTDDAVVEKKFTGIGVENIGFSVTIVYNGQDYASILSAPQIAPSIFNTLYFMKGHGLSHFKLFSQEQAFTGETIMVWKIDWEGKEKNDAIIRKEIVAGGDTVRAEYIGFFEDDAVFDSSIVDWGTLGVTKDSNFSDYQTNPLEFVTGTGTLIPGFEKAVIGMKPGDEKIIKVPPEEGYGMTDGPYANKTLYFKIRVVEVR